jgi:surface antigen
MFTKTSLAVIAAALMASIAASAAPGPAQRARPNNPQYQKGYEDGYQDAYRKAYREGFSDARGNRRFDDSDYSYGYGNDNDNDYGNDPRYGRWRQRYTRTYTYTDDNFYQECRTSVDPAGVIAGALIGGLLGNAVGNGRGAPTVAGVIVGGTVGAALTRDLNCDDRSYAYKSYYDGFNAGRPNATYQWRNPRSNNYGNFRVADYYNDPDGFRCANYTQQIFINGRPQAASGRACQQPDGTWAIVN